TTSCTLWMSVTGLNPRAAEQHIRFRVVKAKCAARRGALAGSGSDSWAELWDSTSLRQKCETRQGNSAEALYMRLLLAQPIRPCPSVAISRGGERRPDSHSDTFASRSLPHSFSDTGGLPGRFGAAPGCCRSRVNVVDIPSFIPDQHFQQCTKFPLLSNRGLG